MRWIAAAREWLTALLFRSRQQAELDEELLFHLEHEAALLREAGLEPEEAWREAQRRFGGLERCREEMRDARGVALIEDLARDLATAVRTLVRRPWLSLGVVATLAIGVGATATIYAVVDGVLLRELPYDEPSALVTVGAVSPLSAFVAPGVEDLGPISLLHYQQIRARARSFEALAAVSVRRLMPLATSDGGELNVPAHELSAGLLTMLDVTTPALGRLFLPEEYDTPDEGAVMISFEEWQSRYGGDPRIIGRTIGRIRGGRFPAVVVGVLPRDFRPLEAFFAGGERPGYYFPRAAEVLPGDRGWETWYVLGRLRPGVSIADARSELAAITEDVARELPGAIGLNQRNGAPYRLGVNGLHAQTVGTSRPMLGMFLGGAALLLVLAAMNAAALLVARSLDRSTEFGIRMALGAGRMRVVRLVLCEGGLLALAGSALGVLFAGGGIAAFLRFAPPSMPGLNAITLNARVLVVAVTTSMAAGLVIGLLPALGFARAGHRQPRHPGAQDEPRSTLRSALVAGQMTLAMVLLAAGGLLFNSFVSMRAVDPGIDAERLVTVTVPYKDASMGPLPLPQAWDQVLDTLRAVPGVQSAAGTTTVPFQSPFWLLRARLPQDGPESWRPGIAGYAITPEYLDTVGTRLLQGRNINRRDGATSERVALVNESFVRTHFDDVDPIGAVVQLRDVDQGIRIVGVVEDVIQQRAEDGFRPALYVPYTQYGGTAFVEAVVRTTQPAEAVLDELRAATVRLVPNRQPQVRVMQELMASTLVTPRFRAFLIGTFALAATMLAAMGLYATMAHHVERRRREIGIRMAIGGHRTDVVWMVLGRGLRLSTIGVTVGIAAGLLVSQALRAYLYGLQPHDASTFGMAAVILMLVSAVACLVPAVRAATVDPVTVLRAD